MQSSVVNRRKFLKDLAVTGAVVAAAPLVLRGTPAVADAPKGEKVGAVADFSATPKKVTLSNGSSVFVVKNADNTWLALSSACTHRGCQLLWVPSRTDYECPCHGGRFSKTGAVLGGPPHNPLPSYAVSVSGGNVYVQG